MPKHTMSRIDWYLQHSVPLEPYVNTPEEEELVNKFSTLYSMALGAKQANYFANNENIETWRKAYYGILPTLDKDGKPSKEQGRQLRKLAYEFVEAKVDNSIPTPKMKPKYKADIPLVAVTEDYLVYNTDVIFTKYLNDQSERSTYVDGTSWYKIWWDSLDNHHSTSGQVKVDLKTADQIVPQPGIKDWRKLEYIFELEQVSLARIYDLTGRVITSVAADQSEPSATTSNQIDLSTITVIHCYYLNEDRVVARFSWAKDSRQVIFNDKEWQIRKLRTCNKCGTIVPQAEKCPTCGSKSFKYTSAENEILEDDLVQVYNPYDVGESDDEQNSDQYKEKIFATKGTEIPYYKVRQLPFVPRPCISSIESLYGISEVFMILEMQDVTNKAYTKIVNKTLKAGAVLTKNRRTKINDDNEELKIVNVNTYEEAEQVQNIQVAADTSQDVLVAQLLYESAKSSSGVTDSYLGKYDASATSGKAKQFAAEQTAGRIESIRIMKAAAFAGVYELVLKYLLAFSDGNQKFVKILPDGTAKEEEWNRYMFLAKDDYGEYYYRDEFNFSTDPVATLTQNRVAMWQEIQAQFLQGMFGDPANPRTLELFWNMMDQNQYPLAKEVLAGIKENSQHLPPQIEQLILQNPNILQGVIQAMQEAGLMEGGAGAAASNDAGVPTAGDNRGGARPNSGPDGNGATHAANVERTNERNRQANQSVVSDVGGSTTGGSLE